MLRLLAKAGKRFALKMKCIKEAHMLSAHAVPGSSKCDQLKLHPRKKSRDLGRGGHTTAGT